MSDYGYDASINGNTITIHMVDSFSIHDLVYEKDMKQFTCVEVGYRLFDISTPLNQTLRSEYAGLIHRHNNENKLGKKLDTGKGKPDNDPTPNPPGRGGGGKVAEFVNTFAIAA